jgi:hypothetical protein
MTNPTSNYSWQMPTSTDLVTDLPADFQVFGQAVDTTTKALNPQTTTGALAYRSATANVNTALPIGTAGQVLTVNSGATAPEWATSSAGGFTLLSTTTLAGTSTTVSSISGSYTHLFVLIENMGIDSIDSVGLKLNGASSPSASYSNASGTMVTSSGSWQITQQRNITANQTTGTSAIWIYNYASTTNHKMGTFVGTINDNSTGLATFWGFGRYSVNTAVTSIQLSTTGTPVFNSGTIQIYGVK